MPFNSNRTFGSRDMRVPVIALLVIALVLSIVYSREGEDGPLHGIQSGIISVTAPLTGIGAQAGSGIQGVGSSIEDATANPDTLNALRDENARLRQEASQLEEFRQENERLKELLHITEVYDIDGVTARVIGKSAEAWNQTVTISAGSEDGVTTGLTVMGPSGVIGQVVRTDAHTSLVRLITDPQSGVAVLIQSNRKEGIVTGSLDGLLYLENVDSDVVVQVGDVVVTSGAGGSYTRGLIVGTVVKVTQAQGASSRLIVVSPNEDTGPLEEVTVVKSMGSLGAAA